MILEKAIRIKYLVNYLRISSRINSEKYIICYKVGVCVISLSNIGIFNVHRCDYMNVPCNMKRYCMISDTAFCHILINED